MEDYGKENAEYLNKVLDFKDEENKKEEVKVNFYWNENNLEVYDNKRA